ncbi:unnamed protein product [Clavelina lepadiformis]|uniref:Transient receptor ion channel domain-containing protein n=2 Tax=Clavelina lepadiformis TaxID=159417 RepID=A0ABP0GZ96_CLALP
MAETYSRKKNLARKAEENFTENPLSTARGRRNGPRANRGSCFLLGSKHHPTPEELYFLEAAEYGDIPTVGRILENMKTLNVNCVDYIGQNALQLACGNEHLEVVEILIKQPTMARIGDALLLAISRGYLRIVETILNHSSFDRHDRLTRSPSEQKAFNQDTDFYAYDDDGTRFSPDITPIILAAQYQEFDIVLELLRRGARIEHPHHYNCKCQICDQKRIDDSLGYSLSRLNAYKGLASPAYLALSSPDPAWQALSLSNELNKLSNLEKEFKHDYVKLSTQCNDFVEKLLDVCHNSEEVDIMLSGHKIKSCRLDYENEIAKKASLPESCTGDTESYPKLYQLKRAIKYKVKKFVAHPSCQQRLIRIWYRHFSWFRQIGTIHKILWGFLFSIFMPLIAVIYLTAPCSKIGRMFQSPFCKFITQASAYAQFVLLLIINCLERMEGLDNSAAFIRLFHQDHPYGRYTKFNWCEVIILIYVTGMLWNEVKELWGEGMNSYMCQLWNMVDSLMLLILISSFTCRGIAYKKAIAGQFWWDSNFGENATNLVYDMTNETLTLYGVNVNKSVPNWAGYYAYSRANRRFWSGSDPQIISEALYSLGIVLSFSRISYILEVNDKFGPLQISLARTVGDIIKWSGIFFMIFGAFLLGLFNLYSYYDEPGAKSTRSFTTLEETFITLFWSIFGLADYKGVEVLYDHQLTRLVGYQLYGAYNIITVIIMLNMLIAMINSSYSEVEGDSDVEWKFARADLMLSYMEKGNTLPVPFNLIPIPRAIICALKWFANRFRSKRRHSKDQKPFDNSQSKHCNLTQGKKREQFKTIMGRIVKRYVIQAQLDKSKEAEITEAELQEIKHDISSLRFELLASTSRFEESMNNILDHLQIKQTKKPQAAEPQAQKNASVQSENCTNVVILHQETTEAF